VFRALSSQFLSIRPARTSTHAAFSCRVKTYWQKCSPFARTPVKYAKFFAERYVAEEIAIF
jgi:hypothetical protein